MAVGAVAMAGLVACGGGAGEDSAGRGSTQSESTPTGPEAPGGASEGTSAIPDLTVLDVASGGEFALGSLIPADRPVLVWFWAPH